MCLNLLGTEGHVDPNDNGFKYSNYNLDLAVHPLDTKRMKDLINLISDKAKVEQVLPG